MHDETLDVLVVDDQPGVRYLLGMVVEEGGHKLYTARDGVEAIEIVRKVKPDLVFMDVRMPRMSGIEALPRIKEIDPRVVVIIMTAYASEEVILAATRDGALCCLTKPFDVSIVREFLRQANRKDAKNGISFTEGIIAGSI